MELSLIQTKIYELRGCKVMLDFDLAEMYGVETRALNQAVKRNSKRFPEDFMFQLNKIEWDNMKSQFVTSSWGGVRKSPFAFTEQGLAMLSGLLNSETAIEVNIGIMRAFVATRNYLSAHQAVSKEISDLWRNIRELEMRSEENLKAINDLGEDSQNSFDEIYIALTELAKRQNTSGEQAAKGRNPVGYVKPED